MLGLRRFEKSPNHFVRPSTLSVSYGQIEARKNQAEANQYVVALSVGPRFCKSQDDNTGVGGSDTKSEETI